LHDHAKSRDEQQDHPGRDSQHASPRRAGALQHRLDGLAPRSATQGQESAGEEIEQVCPGVDRKEARARAERGVIMLQGSLVFARGIGTTRPFRDFLKSLPDELLGRA
jgi:hypothetical protein